MWWKFLAVTCCSATKTSKCFQNSDGTVVAVLAFILFIMQITMMMIRLQGYAGWSASLHFKYNKIMVTLKGPISVLCA